MPSQQERKNETRAKLLEAAAAVFAARGIEGASIDAIAEQAGRTSGAIYAHFGSKEGLLLELLESWRHEVVAAIRADLASAESLDERLAALWRNFADDGGHAGEWVQLEHELWRWATGEGHEDARMRLRRRYSDVWRGLAETLGVWRHGLGRDIDPEATAVSLIGLLIGLEMQHRLAPDVVDEKVAVESMKALLRAE
jgi:AcrR family transcriptional regulator